jgi:phospholipid/cholesterol/gamma-HCH transport system ATP-binding protein
LNYLKKANESIIEVEELQMRFGEIEVHNDISFTVRRGNIVALIGGSGSGKSTILKEIIGLLRPTSGKALLFGKDVWKATSEELREIRSRIGVLYQNGALFSGLTVAENVAVPLVEKKIFSQNLIQNIVYLRLALAGLSANTASKMPSELSGGMVKRVALARALSLEPEVLFLDEPTSGLDPINARAFDRLTRTLCDSLGLTVFIVTHDLDTLLSITDQVIVLDSGRVLGDGPVEEIMNINNSWLQDYFSSKRSNVSN